MITTQMVRRMVLLAAAASVTLSPWSAAADDAFRLVSPDWLAQHAADGNVKVLDVRTSVADYQHGHVPGAIFLANDALRAPMHGVPVQYLDPESLAALFRRAGINPGDEVVVYADGEDVLGATMVAYALHRIGHRQVAILDGGFEAYRRTYPLTKAYPDVAAGTISHTLDPSLFVTLAQLRPMLNRPDVTLLDVRPAPEYLGNSARWIRPGHIPGAINLDWHQLVDPANPHRFRPVDEMRRIVQAAGVDPADEIVVYCSTGREATLVFLALKHRLGYPNVRLYEGSWTEYTAQMDLPVERDPAGAAAAAHRPPTTDRLEPYQCGSVARLHTWNNIFLASQPSPEDFELARMGGIRTVINQRHEREITTFNERDIVSSLGMTYHNPAWNGPDELTDEIIDRTRELLRTAERPVLIHCASANRTGAIWLAFSVLDRGLSWDEALAEAKTVGLRSPDYERIIRDYIRRRQAR